jgi:hypothetical protein
MAAPPPPAVPAPAPAPAPRVISAEELLLRGLLEPSAGQRQAVLYAAGGGGPGVALAAGGGGQAPNILLFSEPWEIEMVKQYNINPATFGAILQFWLSANRMPPGDAIQNAQTLLGLLGARQGAEQDDRAAWLIQSGTGALIDVHLVKDAVAFMQARVSPADLPQELSDVLTFETAADALSRTLGRNVLLESGRFDLVTQEDYAEAVYARAYSQLPDGVQLPVLANIRVNLGGGGGPAAQGPLGRAAPSYLLLEAARSLRARGFHLTLPFSYDFAIRASGRLQEASPQLAPGKTAPRASEAKRPPAASRRRTQRLRTAMRLQEKLASVRAELANANQLNAPGTAAGLGGPAGGVTTSDWLADLRRQHLANRLGGSDLTELAVEQLASEVEILGSGPLGTLMQAHDLAYRDAVAWPSSLLAELGMLRMRYVRHVADAWADERMGATDDALRALGFDVSGTNTFLRTRQAMLATLWTSLVSRAVRRLMQQLADEYNLLKMPVSGGERAHFTRRWLDAAWIQHTFPGGSPDISDLSMLRQIGLALHSEQTLRDTADEWLLLRLATHPGESASDLRAFLRDRILVPDVMRRLPADVGGVVRNWDTQLRQVLRDGLDAELWRTREDRQRTRAGESTEALEMLYGTLYAIEALETVQAAGRRQDVAIEQLGLARDAYRALATLVAFPANASALMALRGARGQSILDQREAAGMLSDEINAGAAGLDLAAARQDADSMLFTLLGPFVTRSPPEYMPRPYSEAATAPEKVREAARDADAELYLLLAATRFPAETSAGLLPPDTLPSAPDVRLHRKDILEYEARRLIWQLTHDLDGGSEEQETVDPPVTRVLNLDADDGLDEGEVTFVVSLPMLEPGVRSVTATLVRRDRGTQTFVPVPGVASVTEDDLSSLDWAHELTLYLTPDVRALEAAGTAEYSVRLSLGHYSSTPGRLPAAGLVVTQPGRTPSVALQFTRGCVRCGERYAVGTEDSSLSTCHWEENVGALDLEQQHRYDADLLDSISLHRSLRSAEDVVLAHLDAFTPKAAGSAAVIVASEWAGLQDALKGEAARALLPGSREDLTAAHPHALRIYLEEIDYERMLLLLKASWESDRLEYTGARFAPGVASYKRGPWIYKSNRLFIRLFDNMLAKLRSRVLPRVERKEGEVWSYARLVAAGALLDDDDNPDFDALKANWGVMNEKAQALRRFGSAHYLGRHSAATRRPDLLLASVNPREWDLVPQAERDTYAYVRQGQTGQASAVRVNTSRATRRCTSDALTYQQLQKDATQHAEAATAAFGRGDGNAAGVWLERLDKTLRSYNTLLLSGSSSDAAFFAS